MSRETIGEVPEVPKRPRKILIAILLIVIVGVAAVSVFIWWYTLPTPPVLVWEKTYGGSESDQAFDIVETGDGGFIVAACILSFEPPGDVYLLKIDADGNKLWEKTYGCTTGSDYCYDIVQSGDGGYVAVGNTYCLGAGGGDVYLLKIDGDGSKLWEKAYGGTEYDEGSSIVQSGDREFIVAGSRAGDVYLLKISERS